MAKIIEFKPKKTTEQICTNVLEEYYYLIQKISEGEGELELAEGYNELYKEHKTEEEYNKCLKYIENRKYNLQLLKEKLDELKKEIFI